ncbi:HAD-IIIA family hydrolase [Sporosarcina highlanderae]|uniref:D,D-heptose 1,7-bisphosphate phosphatase n=1 Tax=Sporosarcina highlanderae TaxID=3035916 RepID=A0ABT8JSN1_9BACL|nr:HAD-IIIA family hydrolase [Sporosarcina highlanderae]MDN4608180.1 HAD-IIIA family hydrolase [Sporosarcina highlanderae]
MLHIQAVFLDRDGTIGGSDRVIYPKEFTLFPGVADSIQQLKKAGILIYSFTNQPGISKGEVSFKCFEEELTNFGFDKIYLCPHGHTDGCTCRKPSPGMLLTAAEENNLNLEHCVIIGDRWTDLIAADEVGSKKILVKTGSGMDAYNKYINGKFFGRWNAVTPDLIAKDVNEAVDWLLG